MNWPIILTLVIATLAVVFFVSKQVRMKKETEIRKLATSGLKEMLKEKGTIISLARNDDLVVNGQRIDVLPVIERASNRDNKWFYGVGFAVQLDGKKDERFTVGSVGIGDSEDEARKVAVDEWLQLFGQPFVSMMLKSPQGIRTQSMTVFPGPMGIRGEKPEGWIDGTQEMHRRIILGLFPENSSLSNESFPLTLNIMVAVTAEGHAGGECRKNGQVSAVMLTQILQLPWPKTGASYMYKQYYILSRG
jgi:hypothetical protein